MAEIAYGAIEKDIDLGLNCGKWMKKRNAIDKFELQGNLL